eukprot:CAMPEP_0117427696 /NCGR_PEP_ID=MMETSP0758-20121206/7513_1 /TAXON_ID=63605 /ORGANISM="Percolomonas cosmopolitus, Strain AE-1 (ATCC 50343)" /LENGTH=223 /DNA_ID=CAMNT_0005213529 /DNA_START=173 /DNA_END=841 /DNA_ORIENTATION=-
MDDRVSDVKSVDTTCSSVYPKIPLNRSDSAASFSVFLMSSSDAPFSSLTVRSTTDTSTVGTLNAIPVSFPFNSGMTTPTAFAAPVDAGIMLFNAALPDLHFDGPPRTGASTVFCVAVDACTVVINPSTIPYFSWIIAASGAKQLVVHDALDTTFSPLYPSLFTPIQNIGASGDGAEMITFFAPPSKCLAAASCLINTPVHSNTTSTSCFPHGTWSGFAFLYTW